MSFVLPAKDPANPSFDGIVTQLKPYEMSDTETKLPLVSDTARHRFTTQEEDVLIAQNAVDFDFGTATITSSVLNLVNSILGAGLLGLPYAVAFSGYGLGVPMFTLFAFLAAIGLFLLMASGRLVPNANFLLLSQKTIPKLAKIADIAVAINCFGVGTSYFVVIGDLMPDVMNYFLDKDDYSSNNMWLYDMATNRRFWIALLALSFVAPIVRLKNLDALKITSGVAIGCFVYVVIIIILYCVVPELDACMEVGDGDVCNGGTPAGPTSAITFIKVVPIYIFGYVCQCSCLFEVILVIYINTV